MIQTAHDFGEAGGLAAQEWWEDKGCCATCLRAHAPALVPLHASAFARDAAGFFVSAGKAHFHSLYF